MTNDDKEFLKEFLRGFVFVGGVVGVIFLLLVFIGTKIQTPSTERVEVVDKYGDCDIIRYLPEMSGKYFYFLDCPTQKHLVLKK